MICWVWVRIDIWAMLVVLENFFLCAILTVWIFLWKPSKSIVLYIAWHHEKQVWNCVIFCKWGISKGRNLACTICCFRTSMECNGDYNNEEDNWCMYLSRFNLRYHNVATCSLFIRSITLLTCCLLYITTSSCYHCIFFFNFVFWYRGYDVKR